MIRDFPGNYTQYREAIAKGSLTDDRQIMKQEPKTVEPASGYNIHTTAAAQKLSFKEKREFEALEKEMPATAKRKNNTGRKNE